MNRLRIGGSGNAERLVRDCTYKTNRGKDSRDWLETKLLKVYCQQLKPSPSTHVA